MDVMPKTLSLQVTGGSTATIDAYEKMRMAGATAREVLKLAAAAQMGDGDYRTENGYVITPDGSKLPYIDLAKAAASITPPKDVTLRPSSEWKYLGRDMPRVDMVAKSTGTAEYGADIRLEGMRFATVRLHPRLGAAMASFDATESEAMACCEQVIYLGDRLALVASTPCLARHPADSFPITW